MTDRELLELAAKAAGYVIQGEAEKLVAQCDHFFGGFVILNENGGSSLWNPLRDDGDALRLAVKLRMLVDIDDEAGETRAQKFDPRKPFAEAHGTDPYAATRRAIVRAAAAIGEGME